MCASALPPYCLVHPGGWSPEQHALFLELRRTARAKGGITGPGALLDALVVLMPGRSRAELASHEAWWAAQHGAARRVRAERAHTRRARASLLEVLGGLLARGEGDVGDAACAAAERVERKAAAAATAAALAAAVCERGRHSLAGAAAARLEAAAAADSTAAAAAARAAAAAQAHEAIAVRRAAADASAAADAEVRAAAAAAATAAAAAAVATAAPAVAARQAIARERACGARARAGAEAEAAAARTTRLAAFASALAPEVARDPLRAVALTATRTAAADAAAAAAAAAAFAPFSPLHGYTDAQTRADPRARATEALFAAGLLRRGAPVAAYASTVLAKLGTARGGQHG
jgi:trimeric autotransporter adhesin